MGLRAWAMALTLFVDKVQRGGCQTGPASEVSVKILSIVSFIILAPTGPGTGA